MSPMIPGDCQLVLDFDGVLCESAGECLQIAWCAHAGVPVEAFPPRERCYRVPADVAERYWRTRPFMRHLAHFVMPLVDGPVASDRAAFAERFASLPAGLADEFAQSARRYREAVRAQRREAWLALHGVWPQVSRLVDGAYIATARDSASVLEILGAHGVRPDPARIFDTLSEKQTALGAIAERERRARADVWLLDDSIDNCRAARAAGFGAGWASWGCGDPGDEAIAIAHDIPVITLDALAPPPIRA
jgi:phosphoglycolate phosphatase-like HAD superfamily hydrolase